MRLLTDLVPLRKVVFSAMLALALPCSTAAFCQNVSQINLTTDNQAFLVSQGFAPAAHVDRNLINPWGMSFSATSPFWTSDQGRGVASLYNGAGTPQALVVTIPGTGIGPQGPTGQVFNGTSSFELASGAPARFIFANLNGTISGWNPAVNATNAVIAATTPNAVYTGLASGSSSIGNVLYAANNAAGRIDVFNQNFQPTLLSGNFVDPTLPSGLAPFNVANIGGTLYVTYATPGPSADEAALGTGVVDRFSLDGMFLNRFVTGSVSNNVLSPWGIVQAPDSFGAFANAFLIGNFADEDGFINAFASDGTYLGMLMEGSDPFNVPYLWALETRAPGSGFDPSAVFFTAGIGDEQHGLFGELRPVPESTSWAMMLMGFGAIGLAMRRRKRTELTFRRAI